MQKPTDVLESLHHLRSIVLPQKGEHFAINMPPWMGDAKVVSRMKSASE